jgi:hypothetical protein
MAKLTEVVRSAAEISQWWRPNVRNPATPRVSDYNHPMRFPALYVLLLAGCSRGVPSEFRDLPGDPIIDIRIRAAKPTVRIIQVADFHFVPEALYALELELKDGKPPTERELTTKYATFLDGLQTFEIEQFALLQALVKRLGVRQIFPEGLTPDNFHDFKLLESLLIDPADGLRDPERRLFLLQYGPAFWLAAEGVVQVVPLDDMDTLMAAKPISKDGKIEPDPQAIENRHDAQLRRILETGEGTNRLVVLGANHDLSAAIRRANLDHVEYVVIFARSLEK